MKRKSLENKREKKKMSVSHILTIKKINLDINKFYFMKEVQFKCFWYLSYAKK